MRSNTISLSPLFLRSLNRLIRAAAGVRDIGDHIVTPIDHPVITINDGIARMSVLNPLREDGIVEFLDFKELNDFSFEDNEE